MNEKRIRISLIDRQIANHRGSISACAANIRDHHWARKHRKEKNRKVILLKTIEKQLFSSRWMLKQGKEVYSQYNLTESGLMKEIHVLNREASLLNQDVINLKRHIRRLTDRSPAGMAVNVKFHEEQIANYEAMKTELISASK